MFNPRELKLHLKRLSNLTKIHHKHRVQTKLDIVTMVLLRIECSHVHKHWLYCPLSIIC